MRTTTHLLMTIAIVAAAALPGAEAVAQNYSGFSLAICQDGSVHSFGRNGIYQLRLGTNSPGQHETQQTVPGIAGAVAVAMGYEHALALTDDGTVYAWGSNAYGCAGKSYPTNTYVTTPTAIDLPGCAVAISAGVLQSMALLADGTVWTWGSDQYGQLGDASGNSTTHVPVQVSGITDAVAIAAGGQTCYALLSTGKVKAWGYNETGECGDASNTNNFTPVTVVTSSGDLSLVTKIAGGGNHAAVLRSDGRIYTWGANSSGQLGRGTGNYTDSNVAIHSSGMTNGAAVKVDIAAGADFTIALKDNGQFRVCGSNNFKQLGTTTAGTYPNPFNGNTVSGLTDIHIPSTGRHGLGVKANGNQYTWGWNSWGQLGDATTTNQAPPVWINDPSNIDLTNTCPAKASEDNHPQPCCVAVREHERIQYTDGQTIPAGTYIGDYISISGTVTIAANTAVTLTGCDVVMWPGAKIIVSAGTTTSNGAALTINGASHLYACDKMWDKIEVRKLARITVLANSIIEDATNALYIVDGANYNIDQAIFNRNYVHINHVGPTTGTMFSGTYRIKRSQFLCQTTASIGGAPVHTNLLPPMQSNITLAGISASETRKCLVGAMGQGNTFDHSSYGIVAYKVRIMDAVDNDLRDMTGIGIYVWGGQVSAGQNNTIDILYNDIRRMPYGVYCHDNDTTARIHIKNNEVYFNGMTSPPQYMTGITVSEIALSPAGKWNFVDVSDNKIYSAPCGINLVNLRGDHVGYSGRVFIGRNEITHVKWQDDWQAGIKTDNLYQPVLVSNTVTNVSGGPNWTETGIRLSNGSEAAIYCNHVQNIGRAFWFDGNQGTLNEFVLNRMDNNETGLLLNWGVIGPQGATNLPHDNTWENWNAANNNTLVLGSLGTQSPFKVRNANPSIYYPQNNAWNSGGSAIPITTTTGTWGAGCYFTGPAFRTDGTAPEQVVDHLALLNQNEQKTDRDRNQHWLGSYNLYHQFLINPDQVESNGEVAAFFQSNDQGSVGRIYRALEALNGITGFAADGATGTDELMAELTPIEPANDMERGYMTALEILSANATDPSQMSKEDAERLRELANSCPLDFGPAVQMARAALISVDGMPKNYINDCEMVAPAIQGKPHLTGNDRFFLLYPNPAKEQLTIEYSLQENEEAIISLTTLQGVQILYTTTQGESGNKSIDLREVAAGTYVLSATVNGEIRFAQPISIAK